MLKLTKAQLKNLKTARCPCKNEPVDKCTCKECNAYWKKHHRAMAPSPSNQLKKTFGKYKLKRSTDEILKDIDGGK